MSDAMTLPEAESRIKEIYEFFAVAAPGVTPREEGELGALWRIVYDFLDDEGNDVLD